MNTVVLPRAAGHLRTAGTRVHSALRAVARDRVVQVVVLALIALGLGGAILAGVLYQVSGVPI